MILGDLGDLMTSSGLSQDENRIFKLNSKSLSMIALALFLFMAISGVYVVMKVSTLEYFSSRSSVVISLKYFPLIVLKVNTL